MSDEFLWHQVYRSYVEGLPKLAPAFETVLGRCGCEVCRNTLIECHLRIVGPIAGQIARKRFPATFGAIPNPHAKDGYDDLVHELIATGNLGLFKAADHFNPAAGRFSTVSNFWIRKLIYEGDRAHDIFGREGLVAPCYLPKRHLATFPVGLTVTKSANGAEVDDDNEIDLLDSDGRTSREYLQRRIGEWGGRFLWRDEGTYYRPRIKLPGHPGGGASRELVSEAERDFEKRRRDWQDNCFREHAANVAKRVLTRVEYRVFAARFLNKKKPTHQALADELGLTESGVRKIKDRAARKVWNAPPLPTAQTVEAMAEFYSVAPGSDLDEFVDVGRKKFPNVTGEMRHDAWMATGQFQTKDYCRKRNKPHGRYAFAETDLFAIEKNRPRVTPQGSFNSWDFVKDNFSDDDKLARRERALAEYRADHPLPTWTRWEPFAVAWLRRHGRKPWIKPSCDWYAAYALAA